MDKLVEGKTNSQPTISRLSDDVIKSMYDKNIAVVAENSVRSPLRIDAVGQKAGHNKKRKKVGDAVESIEHLYCEGKKWHLQIAEKLSTLQDMLESRTDKCLGEGRCLVPDLQDNDHKKKNAVSVEEVATQQLHISNELKSKLGINGIGETYIYPNDSRPANNATGIAHACNEKIVNARIFEEVADKDYMKFLELDNPFDEESYRVAIERPLSPTLPEIGFQIDNSKSFVVGCFNGVLSVENDNMVPSCSLDVEIDYSKLNVNTSRTCHEKETVDDFCEILENDEKCKSQTMHAGNSSMNQLWNLSELGLLDTDNKGINISLESNPESARDDFPRFCVVFSDTNDNSSISKIFSATRTCLTRCSMISQTDRVVQKTLLALLKVEDLLPKEKVCVFFSVLLQNFPGIALENFKNHRDGGLIPFFDSFGGRMRSVMQNLETRRMFEELLNLDELLNLIEDFLVDRRVLVHGDVSSDSLLVIESRASIVLSDGNVILSFQAASAQQLVAAAIVLASLCAAIDHIGFVCEASYNIFKMQNIDSSTLAILHVFAYISGAKYFINNDYSLLVTVIKSLVTFLERAKMSTGSTSYCQSLIKVQLGFPPCYECPFSEGVVSMDVVVSLLMEKLDNYALSDVTYEDLIESIVFLNSKALDSKEKTKPCSGLCVQYRNYDASLCLHKSGMATSPETDSDKTLSNLGDVLSLFELVASNMSWNWTFNNIVLQLLKKLDSCVLEKCLPAIVILLGQLGRLGVDANGYDDTNVENLRGRLSAFLCRSASSNMALPIQIATVTALLGVISLSFEELIKSSTELPEVASSSCPSDCIRRWFSLLSNEQQSLSMRLLIAGVPSCGTG